MTAPVSPSNAPPKSTPRATGRQREGMNIRPVFWEFIYFISCLLMRLRLRVEIIGADKNPRGPVLLAAKHGSSWDIPLLSRVAREALGRRAYFQMGSFIGYSILGRIVPFMRWCGGFCVMRPKELRRLKRRQDLGREELHARMDRVNRAAEATRRAVLEEGGVLVFFPEGTRNDAEVLPLKATNEIATAVELRFVGVASTIWPVVISYGPKSGLFRRRVRIECLDPLPVAGVTPEPLCAEIERRFRVAFQPSDKV